MIVKTPVKCFLKQFQSINVVQWFYIISNSFGDICRMMISTFLEYNKNKNLFCILLLPKVSRDLFFSEQRVYYLFLEVLW